MICKYALLRGTEVSFVSCDVKPGCEESYAGDLGTMNDAPCVLVRDDAHAEVLIANATSARTMLSGYPCRGITLSTSPTAQTRWTALYAARDAVAYPLTVFSADDAQSIEIKDAAEVAEVFVGMVSAMTKAHQAGAKAKAAIEVDAAQVKR